MEQRPLTRSDIEIMRRSLGMAQELPADQVRWLLEEAERLVVEREQLNRITQRLRGPWRDVRAALNELHRIAERD